MKLGRKILASTARIVIALLVFGLANFVISTIFFARRINQIKSSIHAGDAIQNEAEVSRIDDRRHQPGVSIDVSVAQARGDA